MGKKSKLSYSAIISPAFGNPNESGNTGLLAFNLSHNIAIERAVNRVRSYALSFEIFSTKMDASFQFDENVYHSDFEGGQGGYDFVSFSGNGNSDLKVKAISINSIKYGTGVAPFGVNFYWGVKFLMMKNDISSISYTGIPYSAYSSINNGLQKISYIPEANELSYTTIGINFGGEINRAVTDMVIVNLGIQSTILPAYLGAWFGGGEGGTPRFKTEMEYHHKERMITHQIFAMKIGVGILLP